jgi:hypothetical protein
MIFDELRKRFASYKLPALLLALMLIAVIGAFLAGKHGQNRDAPDAHAGTPYCGKGTLVGVQLP